MSDRYEIRNGRFGDYFYDLLWNKEVDLKESLNIMNKYSSLMNIGEAAGGIQR